MSIVESSIMDNPEIKGPEEDLKDPNKGMEYILKGVTARAVVELKVTKDQISNVASRKLEYRSEI